MPLLARAGTSCGSAGAVLHLRSDVADRLLINARRHGACDSQSQRLHFSKFNLQHSSLSASIFTSIDALSVFEKCIDPQHYALTIFESRTQSTVGSRSHTSAVKAPDTRQHGRHKR